MIAAMAYLLEQCSWWGKGSFYTLLLALVVFAVCAQAQELTVTSPEHNIFNGDSVSLNCSSDVPITSPEITWTVTPAVPMEALSFSGPRQNTITISPVTADVSFNSPVRPVSVECSAAVMGLGQGNGLATFNVFYNICAQANVCQRIFGHPPGISECVFPTTGDPRCECRHSPESQFCRVLASCARNQLLTADLAAAEFLRCAVNMGCTLTNPGGMLQCSESSSNSLVPSHLLLIIVMVGMVVSGVPM
ncbi:uncharacterized protein LOC135829626 [Sycon ciliatum]|uniref:uncharacterized protein LOC135829626 n=1 Tax=Sycon ciliatum TaxID=27933 RepID=UPI0031F5F6B3|eukprot:scpid87163/ scgid29527/ 